MKTCLKLVVALLATVGASWIPAQAQLVGDAAAGESKAATCAACHGTDGNSVIAVNPKLAGQHADYTLRQLKMFKSGERQNAIMAGMVAGLSEQDMADLAAFYAEQTVAPGVAEESMVEAGQLLYRAGDPDRGIPACMACHGPAGSGNPLTPYPTLAGQHSEYTQTVLTAFRDGMIWGEGDNENRIMNQVAENMSDADIDVVSTYLEGLHAR